MKKKIEYKVEYELGRGEFLLTPCPFKDNNQSEYCIKVGSYTCQNCPYNVETAETFVICKNPKEIK